MSSNHRITEQNQRDLDKLSAEYYIVDAKLLRCCINLMHRLYTEKTLNADDMRDWAHSFHYHIVSGYSIQPYLCEEKDK